MAVNTHKEEENKSMLLQIQSKQCDVKWYLFFFNMLVVSSIDLTSLRFMKNAKSSLS